MYRTNPIHEGISVNFLSTQASQPLQISLASMFDVRVIVCLNGENSPRLLGDHMAISQPDTRAQYHNRGFTLGINPNNC